MKYIILVCVLLASCNNGGVDWCADYTKAIGGKWHRINGECYTYENGKLLSLDEWRAEHNEN